MKILLSCVLSALVSSGIFCQPLKGFSFSAKNPLQITGLIQGDGEVQPAILPLFSFEMDRQVVSATDAQFRKSILNKKLAISFEQEPGFEDGLKGKLAFKNLSRQEVLINNIVPFGMGPGRVYIAGRLAKDAASVEGPSEVTDIPKLFDPFTKSPDTSRSFIYRPGYAPVEVVVPHNNQDLGFGTVQLKSQTLYGLIRRAVDSIQNYLLIRAPYRLQPGKEVTFLFYAGLADGGWQEALLKCFQEKKLYDTSPDGQFVHQDFDNHLYEREDLAYMRHAYTMHLMMAWDKDFFDPAKGGYQLQNFLTKMKGYYGGDDVLTLWPTWPALGMDQRTQWDLMADLPGGLAKQRELSEMCRSMGAKFFISYNPWDDVSEEAGLVKMTEMLAATKADGVVLDTKAEASTALQNAADAAHPGIVLYSEGMAAPKDMQGIIAGRVHNDIYHAPLLNLNKLIKPDFAIFRVVEVAKERTRREYAISLFNGHGVEVNVMRPGRPAWMEDDYRFWGRCVRILRESSIFFCSPGLRPLVPTFADSIYVNEWQNGESSIYTIYSTRPEGYRGPLFQTPVPDGFHCVDLWNHRETRTMVWEDAPAIVVDLEPFDSIYLGTNNEGAVGAIAVFPKLLSSRLEGDCLFVKSKEGDFIKIWEGDPAYDKAAIEVLADQTETSLYLHELFGRISSKYVMQLFENNGTPWGKLLDEQIVHIQPGKPILVSKDKPTSLLDGPLTGMVEIPGGAFLMEVANGDEFIGYPKDGFPKTLEMHRFFMDKHPVTNLQFKAFLDATGYIPTDTSNFLKNWKSGMAPPGQENFPVVHVNYEDAQAYANWAGKRLPTEAEWQYAAQAGDDRRWPWGNYGETIVEEKKKVSATFSLNKVGGLDPTLCNPGSGELQAIGSYPLGVNPYGLQDLVGCVWHLTNDWYQSDTYGFIMLKGGSYYQPGGSWWYVQGGPKPLPYRQMLLRVSQGFERNGTVGFRCVVDAK